MGYLVFIAVCVIAYLALDFWVNGSRQVYKYTDIPAALEAGILPLTRRSLDGHRTFVFHQASGSLLQILKRLPRNAVEAHVSLKLSKLRVPEPARYDLEKGRGYRRMRLRPRGSFSPWRLPSPSKASPVEEADCGASLKTLESTIRRMLSEEGAGEEGLVLYVWGDMKGGVNRTYGTFTDT
jgi:hypothetical protein